MCIADLERTAIESAVLNTFENVAALVERYVTASVPSVGLSRNLTLLLHLENPRLCRGTGSI